MNNIKSIIFDLDGTLWDPCHAVALGWNSVLLKNRIPFREILPSDIGAIAGKPHDDCIRTIFQGVPEREIQILIDQTMEEDMVMLKLHGGILYEGVRETLHELALSYPLYIVSNCQQGYIENFLEWSRLGPLFKDFECWGNTGKPKSENIKAVVQRNNLHDTIYIGDTASDFAAANAAHLPFIQVTYGFGKPIEGARKIENFRELLLSNW